MIAPRELFYNKQSIFGFAADSGQAVAANEFVGGAVEILEPARETRIWLLVDLAAVKPVPVSPPNAMLPPSTEQDGGA